MNRFSWHISFLVVPLGDNMRIESSWETYLVEFLSSFNVGRVSCFSWEVSLLLSRLACQTSCYIISFIQNYGERG